MSGGAFEYKQHYIEDIACEIDRMAEKHSAEDWYSAATIERMKQTAKIIRRARELVHSLDYLLSGDIVEDTFEKDFKRLATAEE